MLLSSVFASFCLEGRKERDKEGRKEGRMEGIEEGKEGETEEGKKAGEFYQCAGRRSFCPLF